MSRHNKVNPNHYTSAGRLAPDDLARERMRQSQLRPDWHDRREDRPFPPMTPARGAGRLQTVAVDREARPVAPKQRPARRAAPVRPVRRPRRAPAGAARTTAARRPKKTTARKTAVKRATAKKATAKKAMARRPMARKAVGKKKAAVRKAIRSTRVRRGTRARSTW
jgi:hypothetical protein